jgi:hypothetical protein
MMLQAYRTLRAVRVVKNDCYTGLGDTSLPAFVDEVLLVGCTHLHSVIIACYCHISYRTYRSHVGDTENKTYRVENVGLARTVETRNGIERGVPTSDLGTYGVRFESYDNI